MPLEIWQVILMHLVQTWSQLSKESRNEQHKEMVRDVSALWYVLNSFVLTCKLRLQDLVFS